MPAWYQLMLCSVSELCPGDTRLRAEEPSHFGLMTVGTDLTTFRESYLEVKMGKQEYVVCMYIQCLLI